MARRNNLFKPFLAQTFRGSVEDKYLYLNNAKAACSTIKNGLWAKHLQNQDLHKDGALSPKELHGRGFWDYNYKELLESKPFTFSVVRNPYSRVLSAYLDKIAKKNLIRNQFYLQHNIDPSEEIKFIDFLYLIKQDQGVSDQHWRPQVQNLFVNSINIDAVGQLEAFSAAPNMFDEGLGFSLHKTKRDGHGTSASNKVERFYSQEAQSIVRELYEEDFDIFKYPTDIKLAHIGQSKTFSISASQAEDDETIKLIGQIEADQAQAAFDLLSDKKSMQTLDDPFQKALYHSLAVSLQQGNTDSAKQYAERVLQNKSSPNASHRLSLLFLISEYLTNAGQRKSTSPYLEEILQLSPAFNGMHSRLCNIYIASGELDKAQQEISKLERVTWDKAQVNKHQLALEKARKRKKQGSAAG